MYDGGSPPVVTLTSFNGHIWVSEETGWVVKYGPYVLVALIGAVVALSLLAGAWWLAREKFDPAPQLGQDGERILTELLHYSPEEIEALKP